jgi:mono/diheme cytochrome c family protein
MFRRFVDVVEVLVLLAAAAFLVLLFANESGPTYVARASAPGAAVYASNCARCHGAEGSGGIGPRLSDGAVVDRFPDAADEIEFVTRGQDGMPAFGGTLSAKEIQQVVEYTRTL